MHYIVTAVFMIISFLGASIAMAQSNEELAGLAKPVLDAVLGGNYLVGVALALVLGVALVRRFGAKHWGLLGEKWMGPILVLVGSFGAAVATSLTAGVAPSSMMLWAALQIAVIAAGGFSLIKPILLKLANKYPKLGVVLKPVMWILTSKDAKQLAEKAGQDAVEANPSEGAPVEFQDVP